VRTVTLFELERLAEDVPRPLLDRLERFDRFRSAGSALDWSVRDGFKARSHVGVVQVPGLTVEVLPKVTRDATATAAAVARANLLHMLSVTAYVPSIDADIASLETARAPLLDQLIRQFAHRLTLELRRGLPNEYRADEDDLPVLRGKLVMPRHIVQNAARRDRFAVRFDELTTDGQVGRVLRGTVLLLLRTPRWPATQRALLDGLRSLDGVANMVPSLADIDRIPPTRANARFAPLLAFCELVLAGLSPAFAAGDAPTFSLTFPMEILYERFLEAFVMRDIMRDARLWRISCHPQARGSARSLVWNTASRRDHGRLKPDLLFERDDGRFGIIDAKWKIAQRHADRSDLFQMYAYARRYDARCLLLYPSVVTERDDDELAANVAYAFEDGHPVAIKTACLPLDVLLDRAGRAALREVLVGHILWLFEEDVSRSRAPESGVHAAAAPASPSAIASGV
jgi:5-methylcytosine-specific restriction enzyme subunit McrC